jgi:protein bicaudal C
MLCSQKLTPLIFSFELPIVGTLQSLPDSNSSYLRSIQEKYNVHVMFRNRPKLYGTMVVIKGCEWEVAMVKQATLLVIQHMCESLAVSNLNI